MNLKSSERKKNNNNNNNNTKRNVCILIRVLTQDCLGRFA